ncbi:hypothetical protein C8Q80DRAFT_1276426 [Daedaleopsis nitida]|nr:hypothetical protein C8Q80DRAFT_1276426 [Daedaleopsis nitida]
MPMDTRGRRFIVIVTHAMAGLQMSWAHQLFSTTSTRSIVRDMSTYGNGDNFDQDTGHTTARTISIGVVVGAFVLTVAGSILVKAYRRHQRRNFAPRSLEEMRVVRAGAPTGKKAPWRLRRHQHEHLDHARPGVPEQPTQVMNVRNARTGSLLEWPSASQHAQSQLPALAPELLPTPFDAAYLSPWQASPLATQPQVPRNETAQLSVPLELGAPHPAHAHEAFPRAWISRAPSPPRVLSDDNDTNPTQAMGREHGLAAQEQRSESMRTVLGDSVPQYETVAPGALNEEPEQSGGATDT